MRCVSGILRPLSRSRIIAAALLALTGLLSARPAQAAIVVSTRFPGITVKPGQRVDFALDVANVGQPGGPVDLAVIEVPKGWDPPTFQGGGFRVNQVYVQSNKSESVNLAVRVPDQVQPGTYRVVVQARSGGSVSTLPLQLQVSQARNAEARLTAEYPALEGPAGATYKFRVDLHNDGDSKQLFSLSAKAPEGWQVIFHPAFDDKRIANVPVEGGSSQGLDVEVQAPQQVKAGKYPITVTAAAGGITATLDLQVGIVGSFDMRLTTPSGRLNAEAVAGREARVPLVVENKGTAPLEGVTFSASAPPNWSVKFDPETVATVPPGESRQVTALIRTDGRAIAGDYVVSVTASTRGTSSTADLRVTVLTSTAWGVTGAGIIVLVGLGVAWVFRKYGRR